MLFVYLVLVIKSNSLLTNEILWDSVVIEHGEYLKARQVFSPRLHVKTLCVSPDLCTYVSPYFFVKKLIYSWCLTLD